MSTSVRLSFLELMVGEEAGEERLAADGVKDDNEVCCEDDFKHSLKPSWLGPPMTPSSASNTKVTLLHQVLSSPHLTTAACGLGQSRRN